MKSRPRPRSRAHLQRALPELTAFGLGLDEVDIARSRGGKPETAHGARFRKVSRPFAFCPCASTTQDATGRDVALVTGWEWRGGPRGEPRRSCWQLRRAAPTVHNTVKHSTRDKLRNPVRPTPTPVLIVLLAGMCRSLAG